MLYTREATAAAARLLDRGARRDPAQPIV